jgi:hypothetical protein
MTRDQMIYLIEEHLLKEVFEGVPRDENGAWDSRKSASNLLDLVQECGMLPPVRKRCPVLLTDQFGWEKEEG